MPGRIHQLSINERRLIEMVFRKGQIARVDLTALSGLTPASVTRLVSGLEKLGLFRQLSVTKGPRGQPKRLLSIDPDTYRSAGIYIRLNRMIGVISRLDGSVVKKTDVSFDVKTAVGIAGNARRLTENLLEKSKTPTSRFLGMGLTIPGNFGSYGTLVKAHAMFPALDGSAIIEELQREASWPVYLENDGTASALGEFLYGGHDYPNPMFSIHLGYGLGGGAVIDGRLYRGANGNACLPGALFPYSEPRPSIQDLQATLSGNQGQTVALRDLFDDDPSKGPVVEHWIRRAAKQLRLATKVISGMFDPELIVLCGGLPVELNARLVEETNCIPDDGPSRGLASAKFATSGLGELCGPIGAAAIPIYATFFPGSAREPLNRYLDGRSDV